MTVVGTLVVPFGDGPTSGAGGAITAEWDDTLNRDAAGEVKSQWNPGDQAYLLVHHDETVRITAVRTTSGTISMVGQVSLPRTDLVGFSAAAEKQGLQYLPAGAPVFVWKGNAGSGPTRSGKELSFGGGQFPCLASITYPVAFTRYHLATPAMTLAEDETWPIRVYIYYEEIDNESDD